MKIEGAVEVEAASSGASSSADIAVVNEPIVKAEPKPSTDPVPDAAEARPSSSGSSGVEEVAAETKPEPQGAYSTRGIKVRYGSDGEEGAEGSPSGNAKKKRKVGLGGRRGRLIHEEVVKDNGIYKPKRKSRKKVDTNRCQVRCCLIELPLITLLIFFV